jgi:hypothetical protein
MDGELPWNETAKAVRWGMRIPLLFRQEASANHFQDKEK